MYEKKKTGILSLIIELTIINFAYCNISAFSFPDPDYKKKNMVYPSDFEEKTGFNKIKEIIAGNCLSPMGVKYVENIRFLTDVDEIKLNISATAEFQNILKFEENFPSEHFYDNSLCLEKIRIEGSFPEIHEVFDLKRSLETAKSILNFFRGKEENRYPVLSSLCKARKLYPYVFESIERIIDRNGNIRENASTRLKEIKTEITAKKILVSRRLQAILKQAQADGIVDQDTEIPVRNGRGVIPVNIHDKRRIKGLIHDQSASGKTVFIEPEEVVGINNDIIELEYEERREIVRILTRFADNIRPYIDDLLDLNRFIGQIDFIRAKALFGNHFSSKTPSINDTPGLSWRKAIHPLLALAFEKLPGREVVPLDISLDSKERILLISGPNAGGKSVCLKTVGLLQYMLQCGFTIPVSDGSESGIFNKILIDIGDEQSIENDLSTYSYHLINMKNFLKQGDDRTLILIDEFGAGTEPGLGGSIAEAILGEFIRKGFFGVITTHYTNLKHYASVTEGIVNGAMAFDSQFMQPLFQLNIGRPGSSFAFEIARKIGLPEEVLAKASEKAGVKNIGYDKSLREIARDKRYWENKRQNIRQHEKRLEEMIQQYERELAEMTAMRKEILGKAREEAQELLKESNKLIENTIRQIRESQAEKEKTRQLRKTVEEFRQKIEKPADLSGTESQVIPGKMISKIRKPKKREEKESGRPGMDKYNQIITGDAVRVIDTQAVGEVTGVNDKIATIETDNIRISVPLEKLEKISRAELRKKRREHVINHDAIFAIADRKLSFKPDIDIRGLRVEEALERVRQLIDDALMLQFRNLRILHGKGDGILQQNIRKYLSTVEVVKSFRDEHPDLGGSGVTVIELDI